jgi:hypothetical protein
MEEHIERLVEAMHSIKHDEVTILTGRNAGGKSLIRKQLIFQIAKALDKDVKKTSIPHASQEIRTRSNPGMGALSSMAHDLEWLATSDNTLDTIEKVFAHLEKADYIVIDEPEIGMGEELQLGLADYLNEEIAKVKALGKGCLVICHSRIIAKNVVHDKFINLEGMSEDEWLNRTPQKISVEDFKKFASDLFIAIRDNNKK